MLRHIFLGIAGQCGNVCSALLAQESQVHYFTVRWCIWLVASGRYLCQGPLSSRLKKETSGERIFRGAVPTMLYHGAPKVYKRELRNLLT